MLAIRDTGIGISREDLPKIKNKFYKANNTRPGSGIGLALADEIIRRPANRFVKDFILNQLEIKRNNIYQLFSGVVPAADMAQASGQIG